jgi:hypothetical protein
MASRFLLETLPQNKKQMVCTVSRKDGEALKEGHIEVTLLWQPGCTFCVFRALVRVVCTMTAVCVCVTGQPRELRDCVV